MCIVFYSLWGLKGSDGLQELSAIVFTIPLLMYILFRYEFDLVSSKEEDAVKIFMKDWQIIVGFILFAGIFIISL